MSNSPPSRTPRSKKVEGKLNRLRIIVSGYIVRGPLGGLAWHHLQYVIGLSRLGHEVHFVEDSEDYESCYDPVSDSMGTDPSYGLEFAEQVFGRVGLGDVWAYHDAHRSRWLGPAADQILQACRDAELLLTLSGVNPLRPWLAEIPARAFIDTDPLFTQVNNLTDDSARALALQHTTFHSFGENIPTGRSSVPDDGFPWQATRQPVVLDAWPVTVGRPSGKFTTVMQWDSYAPLHYAGRRYGMKSDSFDAFLDLPLRTEQNFELALGGPTNPAPILARHGWSVRDPREPTRDPWTYQEYIRRSKAEFSIAKHGYVVTRSGWFSERSAAYLASGRPVLVQDTGFSDWLDPDAGVVAFSTPDEALTGLERIALDYGSHCKMARLIAEDYFDAAAVLRRLLESALGSASEAVKAGSTASQRR
jgi:hypothetical protein